MSQTVPGSKWWFVSVIGTSGLDSLTSNQKEVGRMIVDLKRCLTGGRILKNHVIYKTTVEESDSKDGPWRSSTSLPKEFLGMQNHRPHLRSSKSESTF